MARIKKSFYNPSTSLKSSPVGLSMGVNKRDNGSSKNGKRSYQESELNRFSRLHSKSIKDDENFYAKFQLKRYGDKVYCLIHQTFTGVKTEEILMGTVTPNNGFIPILDRWEEISDKTNKDVLALHKAVMSFLKYSPMEKTVQTDKPTVKKVLSIPTVGKVKLIK